ncbi:hypothetical protein D0525_24130 [Salmonella enterica]|uniref:hypothetical protein n=1 Tax=Salmonella enterica TaxID=28901 RepID=UPI001010E56C|nr:hypothetical protein [Salmonella enterica]RXO32025.1 hypothetical protein D0525_24130 [Salmonella enterica]
MMKQISDNMYTTDNGELSITPSLDVIFRFKSVKNTTPIISKIFSVLQSNHAIQLDNIKYHLILSNNYNDVYFEKRITPEEFIHMEQAFKSCVDLAIRKKTTLLTLFYYDERTSNNTEMLRIACSNNFFSDDPVVLSLQVFSGADDSWRHLEKLRDDIIAETGVNFFYSSIGYRFIVNTQKVKSGVIAMQNLCMRYLGVDLDDSFSIHLPLWINKLRTINWKTSININDFNNDIAMPKIIHWQTGDTPSVCDRNSGAFDSIFEYKEIDKELKLIIYTSDSLRWLSKWSPDIYARWMCRWEDVKC